MKQWIKSGAPWVWLTAGSVSISIIMVIGLLAMIAVRGLSHFWPADVVMVEYEQTPGHIVSIMGEITEEELVPVQRVHDSGIQLQTDELEIGRQLFKVGNRDIGGFDFRWLVVPLIHDLKQPRDVVVLERTEWGNFYGFPHSVLENGQVVAQGDAAWQALQKSIARTTELREAIHDIEKSEIGYINGQMERLRLEEKGLDYRHEAAPLRRAEIAEERAILDAQYNQQQRKLTELYTAINRDSFKAETTSGQVVEIPLSKIIRAFQPNAMSMFEKIGHYVAKLWEFVSEDPREANTEGGIFPAIFGTVMMVMIMAVLVTPFGVVAAIYLREYAKQGPVTRTIRIAVNNLAGVPSIVYGVFGLGFFVYVLGGSIDQIFYPEALPAPTFGTPGLLWASITLALLTVPVVIVATEEGLSRIPSSIREGSLALGATKAETLWRTIVPMASPAIMTGLILAVARAAGEVAPLMLVGVVKLAASLPVDAVEPFIHLDRKFMHLGFHIYDVGFQSPNVEAARPLVYATALLLVLVIIALNLAAIAIRNRLREKYKSMEH